LPPPQAVETFRGDALAFTDFEQLVEQALAKRPPTGPRAFLLPDRGDASVHALHFAEQLRRQSVLSAPSWQRHSSPCRLFMR
jgi:hypothetical protein